MAPDPSNPGELPRTTSGSVRAVSAARMQPVKTAAPAQGPVSARLKDGAAETALNAAGILRDAWADFRSRDQFFKYKALIIACWVLLSGFSVYVAWPGASGPQNSLGARLVVTHVLDSPVFMIVNESGEQWEDVVVVVNDTYRASVALVGAKVPDNTLTLSLNKLLGQGGAPAPADLVVRSLQVRTSDGKADLMAGGRKLD